MQKIGANKVTELRIKVMTQLVIQISEVYFVPQITVPSL